MFQLVCIIVGTLDRFVLGCMRSHVLIKCWILPISLIQLIVGKRVVGGPWILIPEVWLVCLKLSVRDRTVSLSVILRDVCLGWSVVVQLSVHLYVLCWVVSRSYVLIKC